MMKTDYIKKIIYLIFMLCLFSSMAYAGIVTEVGLNKYTIINLKKPCEGVAIANPAIADVRVVPNSSQILVWGKGVGSTSLIIWENGMQPTFFDVRVITDKIKNTPQVMLEVKVAQIDKNKLSQMGIHFLIKGTSGELTTPGLIATPTGNVGGIAGPAVTPGIGSLDVSTLSPQLGFGLYKQGIAGVLQQLSTGGYAKILAEPNLIVRSGEKGKFLVGQKVPIQTVTGTGGSATVSIVYEQVGVRIDFSPEVLEDGIIKLKIDPAEVSSVGQLEQFSTGLFAPIIDTREVRTTVDLRDGESFVIAGLLDERMKKNIKKFPVLGDVPILGALFRSTSDELDKTELVFFITPKIVKPLAPGVKIELPGSTPLTPAEKNDFKWIPLLPVSGGTK
jgi:pilus assembly protein CpaC